MPGSARRGEPGSSRVFRSLGSAAWRSRSPGPGAGAPDRVRRAVRRCLVQLRTAEPEVNTAMLYGALIELVTGVALVRPGRGWRRTRCARLRWWSRRCSRCSSSCWWSANRKYAVHPPRPVGADRRADAGQRRRSRCCGSRVEPSARTSGGSRGTERDGVRMRLSARVDYALRAMAELAAADAPRTVDQLSAAQNIPNKYLESILGELRRGGLLRSQRGPDGGYRLARPAARSASPTSSGRSTESWPTSAAAGPRTWSTRVRRPPCRRSGSPCGPRSGPSWKASRLAHVADGQDAPSWSPTLVANPSAWA